MSNVITKNKKLKKTISYSELSMYLKCPHKWKLSYKDGLRKRIPSIHTIFGTAIHNTIQHYLTVMYEESIRKADEIDMSDMLHSQFHEVIKDEFGDEEVTMDAEELKEFFIDGLAILTEFKKKRHLHFPKKGYELTGVEVPIRYNVVKFANIKHKLDFLGFADVIIHHPKTNTYKIIDIKTSTRSWGKYKKQDKIMRTQLVLYKIFLSKLYNVPVDNISVEYFIVKRKIKTNIEWPEKRIQIFEPSSGKVTRNQAIKWLGNFIDEVYNVDANDESNIFNDEATLPKIGGHKRFNCTYCEFKDDLEKCNKSSIVESVNNVIQYNKEFKKWKKEQK